MPFVSYLARLLAALMLAGIAAVLLIGFVLSKNATPLALAAAGVFGVAGFFTWPRRPNAWRHDPPTDRQLAFARDLGIRIPRGVSKGQLSDMISQAKQIRDAF